MNRDQLEHVIRAAAELTNRYEFIIVGSQSILGALPNPQPEFKMSMEVDIYARGAEELSDLIDGNLGEGSPFHDMNGYYAQGVDSTTAKLPRGWENRLVRVQSERTNGRAGFCLDVTDLFMSKCHAHRDKDREFNRALLRHGHVKASRALALVGDMPVDDAEKQRMKNRIRRLVKDLQKAGVNLSEG